MSCAVRATLASLALALTACAQSGAREPEARAPASTPPKLAPTAEAAPAPAPAAPTGPLRLLAIGGGPTPESTEVSIEQDIGLVLRAVPPPHAVLFAGGGRSLSVRELDSRTKGDPVLLALAELLAPRAGRQSRYRAPRFAAERATIENVEAKLSAAFAEADAPLLVYIASHGDQGSEARNNTVALWGGGTLSVERLAELHEQHRRPLRLVATSCFSGGFAELAFAHADDSANRPSKVPRCGLFAGTADRETSGCDPNPDRRARESYGLHFVSALTGTTKGGSPLPLASADHDGDGKIGLLEAHTWARIEAVSFDVPTTTSERWLRSVEPGSAPIDKSVLPEDFAVVERLGAALELGTEKAVDKRWKELDREISDLQDRIDQVDAVLAEAEAELTRNLLEHWPVLDDAFHPDFIATFSSNRAAIQRELEASPPARARADAIARTREMYERLERLAIEEARVLRVRRAYETLHKAAALAKRGGPNARYYASLLACERSVP